MIFPSFFKFYIYICFVGFFLLLIKYKTSWIYAMYEHVRVVYYFWRMRLDFTSVLNTLFYTACTSCPKAWLVSWHLLMLRVLSRLVFIWTRFAASWQFCFIMCDVSMDNIYLNVHTYAAINTLILCQLFWKGICSSRKLSCLVFY